MYRILKSARTLLQPSQCGDNLDQTNQFLIQNRQIQQIQAYKKTSFQQSQMPKNSLITLMMLSKSYVGLPSQKVEEQFQHNQSISQNIDKQSVRDTIFPIINSINDQNFAHIIDFQNIQDKDQVLTQLITVNTQYMESQFTHSKEIQDLNNQSIFDIVQQIKMDKSVF